MKRGDIFTAAGGLGYAGKPRPVIVFHDMAIAVESVIVVPVTSDYAEAPDIRVYLPPCGVTGLRVPSWAMAEKISAAPKSTLGAAPIGCLPAQILREVEQAVLVATGIAAR
ncbi:MAG: type II toxin-antitoxin system PemK/MazF family toxin [Bifidobacteriaceae bacterium]|jgi:mRNA interferase MazF|nr:type II toxin-antitoxin system PemK/MazF family toxin [Bifidobacteriaceae bacterium]